MTARTIPTKVTHFTHVDHLATVIERGLLSDTAAQAAGVLTTEVGNLGIKDRRRQSAVPVPPGGAVADHVPFYFAPRSPMMFSISKGNVPSYKGGTARLIYLVTTLERLHELGHRPVLTDRNAALNYTEYRVFDPPDLIDDDFIDWGLMSQNYWNNTLDEPQRMERRMAEALVHERVSWEAITMIGTRSQVVADEVLAILAVTQSDVPVHIQPDWYF
ncbi:DUF4433 domain-containing protein [Nocardiopsis tropica]|uniref:DUF4433 domain-containing protein n=1 Tax=Nocardiopsis tropica TaxID=109330 RepID=A0ABU7KSH7_9ACTN|nr:DUF4433 domain-containing protein [Nocardiopsis umidischolae]MEE2052260.1 DUF4433 domain-containing protein [Nocardiopsis umidischolae]